MIEYDAFSAEQRESKGIIKNSSSALAAIVDEALRSEELEFLVVYHSR
jgi:hypothetical protein